MFLALVQQQGLEVVAIDRVPRNIKVPIPQSLENRQTLPPTPSVQQTILRIPEGHHPGVAFCCGLLVLANK